MTKKRTKSQDENITTEDLGNGYVRVRVEGPNSEQRARDFIDTNFDNPAYYQGDLKDLEVVAYDPKSHQSRVLDDFRRSVGFPTASEMGTTYKYVEPSKPKVDDGFTDAERERYLHNLEKSGFNFDYANRVLKADRYASQYNPENFLKATGINALDPTQWVGAFSDKLTGKVDENGNPIGFWQSLGYGNSGLVTDNFMREHPILGTSVNMIGGGATVGLGNKVFNLTRPLVQQGYGVFQNGVNSIQGRFSPGGWFTLGNKQYRPSMSTLSSGFPVIESRPAWQLQELPGFQIKSLFKGSPLEKQLSKNGTLSLKQLQAYVNRNDVSTIDKELLGRVLQNHANDRVIDYNTLRQEVQGVIPQYTQHPESEYVTYGMDRLGFQINKVSDGAGGLVDTYSGFKPNTFTFESPGIQGNAKHYNQNTLGHSRTYTTTDEPDVLHVMESQSDWAQHPKEFHERQNRINEIVNNFKNAKLNQNTLGYSEDRFNEFYTKALDDLFNSNIQSRMIDTYPIRQLQENLQYAAKSGQHKMRYPTPETAAKIEGYQKIKNNNTGVDFEIYDIEQEIQKLNQQQSQLLEEELNKIDFGSSFEEAIEMANNKVVNNSIQQRINQLTNQIKELKQSKYQYSPEHQTILKKYADFPKQFQKLFGKQTPVRTVTDAKSNTWYEVDVPQNYLNGTAEMLFKKGGKLNQVERFKKYRKR